MTPTEEREITSGTCVRCIVVNITEVTFRSLQVTVIIYLHRNTTGVNHFILKPVKKSKVVHRYVNS